MGLNGGGCFGWWVWWVWVVSDACRQWSGCEVWRLSDCCLVDGVAGVGGIRYFGIDCRPKEHLSTGRFPTAYFLDPHALVRPTNHAHTLSYVLHDTYTRKVDQAHRIRAHGRDCVDGTGVLCRPADSSVLSFLCMWCRRSRRRSRSCWPCSSRSRAPCTSSSWAPVG